MNIQMELRKCCNHPFMVRGVEDHEVDQIVSNLVAEAQVSCDSLVLLFFSPLPLPRAANIILFFLDSSIDVVRRCVQRPWCTYDTGRGCRVRVWKIGVAKKEAKNGGTLLSGRAFVESVLVLPPHRSSYSSFCLALCLLDRIPPGRRRGWTNASSSS